jgi:hypothetical protein
VSRSRLPPLNAIKAFEAAARLGSFTRAAEELNVTHGAVSRQIRLLEDWLGVRLFLRTSRNAVPTQAGSELLAEAGPAPDRLAVVSRQMQNRARARGLLRVSALPTFAMRWLIRRLPDFQRDHPDLELRIVTASTPAEQFRMDGRCRDLGPVAATQLGWNAISQRDTLASVEPRPDEKMPAAGAGRSRTAHAASTRQSLSETKRPGLHGSSVDAPGFPQMSARSSLCS